MKDEAEPVKLDITPGAVVINHGCVYRRGEAVVALLIDMATKYADIQMESGGPAPTLWLGASKASLHLDPKQPRSEMTSVSFPEFVGWDFFCCEVSRYSLHVCLVKGTP